MQRTPHASSRRSTTSGRLIESLESRQLFSGTIALTPTGTLYVLGTAADDKAAVVRDSRGTATPLDDLLHVRLAHGNHAHTATVPAPRVKLIVFKGYAGNDFFENATNISSIQAGGAGNDTLVGGDGNDRYVFDSALNASTNVDRLSDFSVADDTVALDGAVFDALPAGALASAAFFIGSAAHDADDRLIYNATTGALFYDADGNGGAATAVQFATLGSGLALTNNDFLVV